MLFKSTVGVLPVLTLFLLLGASPTAFANDQAKLALAKKMVFETEQKVSPYATPDLKKLLRKAHQIDQRESKRIGGDIACGFFESTYLGAGDDGPGVITNWKAGVTKSGMVRATFHKDSNSTSNDTSGHLIEFDMTCRGQKCLVDDVRIASNWESATLPQRTQYSLRKDAQAIVNANGCGV